MMVLETTPSPYTDEYVSMLSSMFVLSFLGVKSNSAHHVIICFKTAPIVYRSTVPALLTFNTFPQN